MKKLAIGIIFNNLLVLILLVLFNLITDSFEIHTVNEYLVAMIIVQIFISLCLFSVGTTGGSLRYSKANTAALSMLGENRHTKNSSNSMFANLSAAYNFLISMLLPLVILLFMWLVGR